MKPNTTTIVLVIIGVLALAHTLGRPAGHGRHRGKGSKKTAPPDNGASVPVATNP